MSIGTAVTEELDLTLYHIIYLVLETEEQVRHAVQGKRRQAAQS